MQAPATSTLSRARTGSRSATGSTASSSASTRFPVKLRAPLTARLKIMANLDIVEYRAPPGRAHDADRANGRTVDLRVSVLPAYHGQRIVLRVLDKSATLRTMNGSGVQRPQPLACSTR